MRSVRLSVSVTERVRLTGAKEPPTGYPRSGNAKSPGKSPLKYAGCAGPVGEPSSSRMRGEAGRGMNDMTQRSIRARNRRSERARQAAPVTDRAARRPWFSNRPAVLSVIRLSFSRLEAMADMNALLVRCGSETFSLPSGRTVLANASLVWRAMLTGNFAESQTNEIVLGDDDPEAMRLVFRCLYAPLEAGATFPRPLTLKLLESLRAPCDKYMLQGVSAMLEREWSDAQTLLQRDHEHLQMRLAKEDQEKAAVKAEHLRLGSAELRAKMMPGAVVDIHDRPPLWIRVRENTATGTPGRTGVIIANDEDKGYTCEIGVRWDDGTESHGLKCCKHGVKQLLYA